MKKVLILLANPEDKDISPLELNSELNKVQESLKHAISFGSFEILIRWAAKVEDLRRELLHEKPQIVHFSGHGTGSQGLILETETRQKQYVSSEALAELFGLCKDYVECVLLNACYSDIQAISIHRYIDYVIGMNQSILDQAAIVFATGFYDGLAAGRSYEDAFVLGRNAIALKGIENVTGKAESLIPVLKARHWQSDSANTLTSKKTNENSRLNTDITSMSRKKSSQSISISGGEVSGQIAQSKGNIVQNQLINQKKFREHIKTSDVLGLIAQIEALVKDSQLPDKKKEKVIIHLEVAKESIREEEQDKKYAAESLLKVTRILKNASEVIGACQDLLEKIKLILKQVLPWFEVTPDFFDC